MSGPLDFPELDASLAELERGVADALLTLGIDPAPPRRRRRKPPARTARALAELAKNKER